jgi:hypothetical protein
LSEGEGSRKTCTADRRWMNIEIYLASSQDRRCKPRLIEQLRQKWFYTPTPPQPAHRDERGSGCRRIHWSPQCNEVARAQPVVRKEEARAMSAIEYQIRGHGCGVVFLKAIEQHITTEQDHCQQAISKIGRRSGSVIAHLAGSLSSNRRSALCGRLCEFSFHAGCARPGEGIVHARGGNGLHEFADDVFP